MLLAIIIYSNFRCWLRCSRSCRVFKAILLWTPIPDKPVLSPFVLSSAASMLGSPNSGGIFEPGRTSDYEDPLFIEARFIDLRAISDVYTLRSDFSLSGSSMLYCVTCKGLVSFGVYPLRPTAFSLGWLAADCLMKKESFLR